MPLLIRAMAPKFSFFTERNVVIFITPSWWGDQVWEKTTIWLTPVLRSTLDILVLAYSINKRKDVRFWLLLVIHALTYIHQAISTICDTIYFVFFTLHGLLSLARSSRLRRSLPDWYCHAIHHWWFIIHTIAIFLLIFHTFLNISGYLYKKNFEKISS